MGFTQVPLSELTRPSQPLNFDEWVADFAARSNGKANCTPGKSYPCKSICLTIAKNCRNPLQGQAKAYSDWLKMGGEKVKATKVETSLAKKRREAKEAKTVGDKSLKPDATAKVSKTNGDPVQTKIKNALKGNDEAIKAFEAFTRKEPGAAEKLKSILKKDPELLGRFQQAAKAEQEVEATKVKVATTPQKAKKPRTASPVKTKKTQSESPEEETVDTKVHSVKKQDDFNDLTMHVFGKLSGENGGLVPIYKLRREIGELVPRSKFNEWLLDMQADDKFQLQGGGVEDSAPDKIRDSITTGIGKLRTFARLVDNGPEALDKASERSQELDQLLKDRPELDPLGTASEFRKGAKIKSQSDFDKTARDAYKRLNEEFNHMDLVPISSVRKAMGDRTSAKEFDDYLMEMQASGKFELIPGTTTPPKDVEAGGIKPSFGGKRYYMRKL